MNFTYLESIKTTTHKHISIPEYVDLIKNNPLKPKIEYLRSLEYKSSEYKRIKESLPSIITSGTFDGLKECSLKKLNGLIFFDIDDTLVNLNDTIRELNDTIPITIIYKSVGGRGLHFFVEVSNLTTENYSSKQNYIKDFLINSGFKIDNSAKGIARKAFISYDDNIIYIPNNAFDVEDIGWVCNDTNNDYSNEGITRVDKLREVELSTHMIPSDIILFTDLCNQIITETQYTKEIKGLYVVDPIDYYKIYYPRIIKDGTKHPTYNRIMNGLIWLNPNITLQQTISYIWYVNNIAENKMKYPRLTNYIKNMYKYILSNGAKVPYRTKRIWFNKNYKDYMNLTPNEKMSIAAKENAKIRKDITSSKIKNEILRLHSLNEEYTQKKIAINLGMGIATIKRHWKIVNDNLYNQ